ncbi:MAG: trimethylamine methyltransferase family protein [Desulfohalobiaceae bacterium]|nr:trimethylamine methyltransferase family protein [Desulfohalobiaceae bacterium]
MNGFDRDIPLLQILSEERMEAVHRATLETLRNTGVRFLDSKALQVLQGAGCRIVDDERVLFPEWLVEDSLTKCPSNFLLRSREPGRSIRLGGNAVYFSSFPGMDTVDLDTWKSRRATKAEQDDGVKVLDALPNLHFLSPYTPYFQIEGVQPVMWILETVASQVRNTGKIIRIGYQKESEIFALQMAQALDMDFLCSVFATSPLTYYGETLNALYRFVEAGFPIHITSGGAIGGSLPATTAGATVVHNAELMAGIVLIQLLRPGTSVVANTFVNPMNMKTGTPSFATIESSLHAVVFNQMWRRYGLPINNSLSGCVNSKKADYQCGYEKAIPTLVSALSGANGVHLHGGIHAELTYHPVQSILDDDVAGMIGHFLRGVDINEETLAANLISQVIPGAGHFLGEEHTLKWFKQEQFFPNVADRTPLNQSGPDGPDALSNAKKRMAEILEKHRPPLLNAGKDQEIERILEEARRYYKNKGELNTTK